MPWAARVRTIPWTVELGRKLAALALQRDSAASVRALLGDLT
jgi:hypothetical protein